MRLTPLSKSTYKRFLVCPWKSHAIKNLGFEEPYGPAAFYGVRFHEIIAEILDKKISLNEGMEKAIDTQMAYLLEGAMNRLTFDPEGELHIEEYVLVDAKGKRVDRVEKAVAHGYLDVMTPINDETLLITDWKSGRWEQDDPFERNLYGGVLGHAAFPKARVIVFQLHFVRSGHILESVYTFEGPRSVHVLDPTGREQTLYDEKGPFTAWLGAIRNKIRLAKAVPTPGEHCVKHYGKPCIFNGAECPLSANVPAVMEDFVLKKDPIQALLAAKDGNITKANAPLVWQAIGQMESVLANIKEAVKTWSNANGKFKVGDDDYGWHSKKKYDVDATFALETLFESGLSYDEMARLMNISKTSLGKLPTKQYPDLTETLQLAITQKDGPLTFGAYREAPEDNGE